MSLDARRPDHEARKGLNSRTETFWEMRERRLKRANNWSPFEKLDTPYRAKRAKDGGATGAITLALANVLTAAITFSGYVPDWTLVGNNRLMLTCVHLSVATVAAVLFYVIRSTSRIAYALILVTWSSLELTGFFQLFYGHGAPHIVTVFGLACAVYCLRGAIAIKQIETRSGSA